MSYTVLDAVFNGTLPIPPWTYGTVTNDLPVRFNIMSTLAPPTTAQGGVPLLTPIQLLAGQPWATPSVGNTFACDKPPVSQLLVGVVDVDPAGQMETPFFSTIMKPQTLAAAFPSKRY